MSAARQRAKELKQDINRGIDPQALKLEERAANTVKELWEDYQKGQLRQLAERSQKNITSMWRDYILPRLGSKRVKDLTSRDIDNLHQHISAHAPVRANRVIASFKAVLNLAIRWGLIDRNPAIGVVKNPEYAKSNYLTPEQLAVVFDYLEVMPNKEAADIIRLLIFTGARLGEVLTMEWSHLNLTKGEWVKPPSNTKQRRIHAVPLSVEALSVVQTRHDALVKKGILPLGYIFPSANGSHKKDIKRPWAWLLKKCNMPNVRVHDLRHTYASLLISGGHALPVIGRLLGHSQSQTTMRYAHLMDNPLRNATNTIVKMVPKKSASTKTKETKE